MFLNTLIKLREFLVEYPNILKAFVALFTLLTTVISLVIAYKSYDNSVKQQEKDKEEKKTNSSKKIAIGLLIV
ncbi:hypothetical protein ACVQ92_06900 [Staphylococcus aureus]